MTVRIAVAAVAVGSTVSGLTLARLKRLAGPGQEIVECITVGGTESAIAHTRLMSLLDDGPKPIALIGTTLSSLSTGARVTYAMGKDGEVPEHFGLLHGKKLTPHRAIWTLAVISAIVGCVAVSLAFCDAGAPVFAPNAAAFATTRRWETVLTANALVNNLYVFRVNRVGHEERQDFYGRSFCVDPKGEFLAANAFISLNIAGALLLGMLVGYDRSYNGRAAGMRTYGLVCMASTGLTAVIGFPDLWFGGAQPRREGFGLGKRCGHGRPGNHLGLFGRRRGLRTRETT